MRLLFFAAFLLLLGARCSVRAKRGKAREPKKRCATPGRCSTQRVIERGATVNENLDSAFHCPSCHKVHCPSRNPRMLNCGGGITTDVCGCCPQCAKLEGESCGGRRSYLGKCDRGLQCEPEPFLPYHQLRTAEPTSEVFSITPPSVDQWRGKCREADEIQDVPGLSPKHCKPKCTAELCLANPKAVCSASDVAIEEQECQGKCQHTACSACFFQEEPPCPRCHSNDFDCIKKFAKCTRKKASCTRNKYPCKKTKKPQSGKFLCWVPKCF